MQQQAVPFVTPDFTPTVPAMLRHLVATRPTRAAVVKGDTKLTCETLERRSAQLAKGFLALGIHKGTRVGMLLPNSLEFVVTFFALTRIGALAVPFSTLATAPELAWLLRFSDVDTLITAERYLKHDYVERLEAALPSLPGQRSATLYLPEAPYLRRIFVEGKVDQDWAGAGLRAIEDAGRKVSAIDDSFLIAVEDEVMPADLMFMVFTSGSTAHPKGVVHSHGAMMRHTFQAGHSFQPFSDGDRVGSLRPLFWIAGLNASLIQPLQVGATFVIPESDDSNYLLDLLERDELEFLSGAPNWMGGFSTNPRAAASPVRLLNVRADITAVAKRDAKTGKLRFASAALESRLPAELVANTPRDRIVSAYGMSETISAHTSVPAATFLPEGKEGRVGRPMPGVLCKTVDPDTGAPCPPGVPGELLVSGYSLMAGLYKKERQDTFVGPFWYRTGDCVTIEEDGFLIMHHRLDDVVKVSGANVAPIEIERALMAMPEIADCAVIGLPDRKRGTLLVATLVLGAGHSLTEDEVISRLKATLSAYKVPRRVVFLPELGRTSAGKLPKAPFKAKIAELIDT